MVKRIIHIADLHIRTIQMHDLYRTQFEKLIEEIKEHATQWTEEGIQWDEIRIVIAGDIAGGGTTWGQDSIKNHAKYCDLATNRILLPHAGKWLVTATFDVGGYSDARRQLWTVFHVLSAVLPVSADGRDGGGEDGDARGARHSASRL